MVLSYSGHRGSGYQPGHKIQLIALMTYTNCIFIVQVEENSKLICPHLYPHHQKVLNENLCLQMEQNTPINCN
jgi:hypothetical protein